MLSDLDPVFCWPLVSHLESVEREGGVAGCVKDTGWGGGGSAVEGWADGGDPESFFAWVEVPITQAADSAFPPSLPTPLILGTSLSANSAAVPRGELFGVILVSHLSHQRP